MKKKNSTYRLSTLVSAAICCMVVFTALALGGVFSYSYIGSLKNEFYDRVHAEGEGYSLEVYGFIHQARSRLEELGRDNSIRVTMMLGVDYPLAEKLDEYNQLPAGVDYFIQRKGDEKIFSSSSEPYDEKLVRSALKSAPYNCSLCPGPEDRISTIFSIPIRSRSELVGTAACLVDFSAARLAQELKKNSGSRILISENGKVFDMFKGNTVSVSIGPRIGNGMTEASINESMHGILFKSDLVPGLSYFAPDRRLNESLYRTFWLLMPFVVAVTGLGVIVSLFISSKLTRPLRDIMDSAGNISNGLEEDIDLRGSRLYEINALQNSLALMLQSLRKSKGLEQYQFFFDNVGDIVCITDLDGMFLEINSTACSSLGYSREEFMSKTFFELVPPYERQSLRGVLNALFAGNSPDSFECVMETSSGTTMHCEIRSRKIEYRGQDALLSVARDVTGRKRDEEELQRYAAELLKAKQVEERNSAHMAETLKKLEEAMARAEVASRTKSDFLAQMSHEIRTPMNSILGMAEMLAETELTEEQKSYVKIFGDSGRALLSLINDILDLSKIESGKLTLENTVFDIDLMVDEVAGIMSVTAWKKGLVFTCQVAPGTPSLFKGDPTRIKQIIVNLLSNAIKFTDSGAVTLEVSEEKESDSRSRLVLIVRDTGIGISEEKVDMIFENFVQADSSTTRKYGGTGLGLSITRNLVKLMEGIISVRNIPAGGAEFRAEISVDRVPRASGEDASVRAAVQGRKILVIEESPVVRNYICDCLNAWGAVCAHCETTAESCTDSEKPCPDAELVILPDKLGESEDPAKTKDASNDAGQNSPSLCTISTSPGDSSNHPEVNRIFGVKGCVRWPVTRGGLRQAMIDIYGTADRKKKIQQEIPDLPPLRILVAEDSESNRMLLDFYLKDTPFRLTYATDGIIAVDLYRQHKYDLVIMDMQMPAKDGYTATAELREYEKLMGYPATPVIALTADSFTADRTRCLKAGCTDYISKPVKKITLIKSILKFCAS
ncbi:ATP-binding protein [Maridesulfovibrio sp.]|uniref:hybrid sensor histidine kinase/response regulator n=1 Tax=Maridesulfovibrio sp. TaxID=2795000 RepID=UPI002A18E0A3|nr:ATP-binding protein [Maridesulfovibrio sp.]